MGKNHKIVNYFRFEVLMKKRWANFQRIVKMLLKIWFWDPGVKKHPIPDPGSGSATLIRNKHPISATLFARILKVNDENY
jgi:hypothetical protein